MIAGDEQYNKQKNKQKNKCREHNTDRDRPGDRNSPRVIVHDPTAEGKKVFLW